MHNVNPFWRSLQDLRLCSLLRLFPESEEDFEDCRDLLDRIQMFIMPLEVIQQSFSDMRMKKLIAEVRSDMDGDNILKIRNLALEIYSPAISQEGQEELQKLVSITTSSSIELDKANTVKECSHFVLPLYAPNERSPTVYFKEGIRQAEIERLVGDLASLLKWDDMVTPMVVDKLPVVSTDVVYKKQGGFKKTIEGEELEKYPLLVQPFERKQLLRAFVISFLLGNQDGHAKNFFITPSKKLIMLDLSRCLPHSNRFVLKGLRIYPVHRLCLLDNPSAWEALKEEDVAYMGDMARDVESQLPEVKRMFLS
ncbi:MAG: hypothetical protein ACK5MA_01935, partial [Parachlamydiaceae bacterium]